MLRVTHPDALAAARRAACDASAEPVRTEKQTTIARTLVAKATDAERRIAFCEVYVPWEVDAHGEAMTPEAIEDMAYKFARKLLGSPDGRIDVMHDQQPGRAQVVASFIAEKGWSPYTEGAWVIGIQFDDEPLWQAVKSGEMTGVSFQAWVKKNPVLAEVDAQGRILRILDDVAEAA